MSVPSAELPVVGLSSKISREKDRVSKNSENPTIEHASEMGQMSQAYAPSLVQAMSPEYRIRAEKALRAKIDRRLLPMVILIYILNYLDRNNIAAARLAGLQTDLNLSSVEYSTSVSILFVGYIMMQIPSNLLLNKIGKPALYLPGAMVIWGAISASTAACQSFGGLVAARFLLGFVEAAYFPGSLYYLSCWYTRKELSLRYALLYTGSLLSGAFSGLIAGGITGSMDGLKGLRAWRWLFIIEGTITIGVAIVAFFILPNFPHTTAWLTEEERELAIWRLTEDIGQEDYTEANESFFHGAKLAFTDIKTYVLMLMLTCAVGTGSVSYFFPTVVGTLGYNNTISLLLTAPPYILCVITTLLNAWHADRTGERFLHIAIPLVVAIIGFIIAISTTATAPRYFSMMIMIPGIFSGFVVILPWISNSIPRPASKRAVALAAINATSITSSIWGSYLYPTTSSPKYTAAFIVSIVMAVLTICSAFVLRTMLARANKKMDMGVVLRDVPAAPTDSSDSDVAKTTFRYLV